MDRFSWTSSSNVCVLPGESGVHQQSGIRIYDGDKKVESLVQFLDQRMMFQSSSWFVPDVVKLPYSSFNFFVQTTFENGTLKLTTHRIIWDDLDQQVGYKRQFVNSKISTLKINAPLASAPL